MNGLDWLTKTSQDYRRGWVEGEAGERNAYLLEDGVRNSSEYHQGFRDAIFAQALKEVEIQ